MLWQRITVSDDERAIISKNGRFGGIFTPGEYRLCATPGVSFDIETHQVRDLVFKSDWADYLANERPEITARHFTRVETNDLQVALIYVDHALFEVLLPAKRLLFWRGAAKVTAELVTVIDEPEVAAHKRETRACGPPKAKGADYNVARRGRTLAFSVSRRLYGPGP